MTNKLHYILCLDLGGTKLAIAKVTGHGVYDKSELTINSFLTKDEFNAFLLTTMASNITPDCQGISIGVPGLVDVQSQVVLDVQNIPHWQNVPLSQLVTERFALPCEVNNDVNCFAVGSFYFANPQHRQNIVALCIGTGLGAGLIVHGKLVNGAQSAAGEFGSFAYQDGILEDYCSAQFFKRLNLDGKQQFERANTGDSAALAVFAELGKHLAHAVQQIVLAVNPEHIVLGGSIAKSHAFFMPSLKARLSQLLHPTIVEQLEFSVYPDTHYALLGAFQLFNLNKGIYDEVC